MSKKKPYPDAMGHLRAVKAGLKYLVENKRITIMYPDASMELPPPYRGMIKLNPKKCTHCGLCARICPSNAIKMYKVDGGKRNPGINYARCVFCGFCVDVCPVGALDFTDVHDAAYYTIEGLIFTPDKLSEEPRPFVKAPKKVKVIFDEGKGLKYE